MKLKKIYLCLLMGSLALPIFSQKIFLFEDFNAGTLPNGWNDSIVSGNFGWQVGLDGANHNTGNQNLDGTNFVYFDDDSHGSSHFNNSVILESPIIDISKDTLISLEFDYNARFYNTISDSFFVDVFDGQNWVNVMLRATDDCGNYIGPNCNTNFPHANIDVSSYANATFQIRFRYFDGNDPTDWGWYVGIDNIKLSSFYNYDLRTDSIYEKRICNLSSTETIEAVIINDGFLAVDSLRLGYQIDTLPIVWDTVFQILNFSDTLVHAFSQTADLSAIKNYNIKVFTALPNEELAADDTAITIQTNEISYPLGFVDSFEDSNIVWNSGGFRNSWERATPNTTNQNTAYSGLLAMVTNANGNYNQFENSYIVSPCFNKPIGTTPTLNFQLNQRLDSRDFLKVEYTIDDGKTWQLLNRGSQDINWANNNQFSNFFTGVFNSWITVINLMDGLANYELFKLRFRLDVERVTELEGVSIDNLIVGTVSSSELIIDKVLDLDSTECRVKDSAQFKLSLFNFGEDTIYTYDLSYRVNGGSIITESVNDTILPFANAIYQFNQKVDLSALGRYDLEFWSNTASDTIALNDSVLYEVFERKIPTEKNLVAPYFEDFDYAVRPTLPEGWRDKNQGSNQPNNWISKRFTTPTSNTGPMQENTSGIGNYVYSEGSIGPLDYNVNRNMYSPCISLEEVNQPVLSYWLHLFGQDLDVFAVDVFDGDTWNNNVDLFTSEIQSSSNQDFQRQLVDISAFQGKTVKLRFRSRTSGAMGDAAIDDVSIVDASLLKRIGVNSACNSTQKVGISAFIENLHIDTVVAGSVELSYELNNQGVFKDTLNTNLAFGDTLTIHFSDSVDLSLLTSNARVNVYAKEIAGSNTLNDTILGVEIPNYFNGDYIQQDFELLNDGQKPNIPNWGLIGSWKLIDDRAIDPIQIPSSDASFSGHKYLDNYFDFTNGHPADRTASIVLPCFTIAPNDSLTLKFKYHMRGDSSTNLFIALGNSSGTVFIDTISTSSPYNTWENKLVDLTAYAGQNVLITLFYKHTNPNSSNGIAIDDIQVLEQTELVDASLFSTEVELSDCDAQNAQLHFTIENNGGKVISPNSLSINYQINGQAVISQNVSTSILEGQKIVFISNPNPNLGVPYQSYILDSWISLNSDVNPLNDSLMKQSVQNANTWDSLVESFDGLVDLYCIRSFAGTFENGWTSENGLWALQNGAACNGTPRTYSGPLRDHGSGLGNFMYINSNSNNTLTASLISPCIDLSRTVNPVLTYWYHMYGSDINTLYVESNASGTWQIIDSIVGQQQMSSISPWLQDTIALDSSSVSASFKIRFRSFINGQKSNIAIDDISIKGDSIVTSMAENKYMHQPTEEDVLVYPNPNNGQFYLYGNYKTIGEEYVILNLQGKQIGQGRLTAEKIQLNLNTSAKGVYFLLINKLGIQKKIIVY